MIRIKSQELSKTLQQEGRMSGDTGRKGMEKRERGYKDRADQVSRGGLEDGRPRPWDPAPQLSTTGLS